MQLGIAPIFSSRPFGLEKHLSRPGDNRAFDPIHPFARTAHSAGLRPGITVAPRGDGNKPLCVSFAVDLATKHQNSIIMCVIPHKYQAIRAFSTAAWS